MEPYSHMRLLVTTQAVDLDDPILGFFHGWIAAFAKNCETVHVICLREGRHELPSNVVVHSLGKSNRASLNASLFERLTRRLRYTSRFFRLAWSLRSQYDAVFVHMNPEYVVLGSVMWRTVGKRVGLWYAHKHVGRYLRIAIWLSHIVFTPSSASLRLKSAKVRIIGHGIDTDMFKARTAGSSVLRIVTVGRVSPTKCVREMVAAIEKLDHSNGSPRLSIIGAPVTAGDVKYEQSLRREIEQKRITNCTLVGPVFYRNLPDVFAHADLALNLSETGSLDKAVLEGFAAKVPVISTNVAFREILLPLDLFVQSTDPAALADAIGRFIHRTDRDEVGRKLKAYVEANHSLSRLIPAIVSAY